MSSITGIAEAIKKRRVALKYTQEDLASLTGLDPSFISGVENGKRNISISTLDKICFALNLEINLNDKDMAFPYEKSKEVMLEEIGLYLKKETDLELIKLFLRLLEKR